MTDLCACAEGPTPGEKQNECAVCCRPLFVFEAWAGGWGVRGVGLLKSVYTGEGENA